MASQTDYDQGGSTRYFERRWLGPSVGWVWTPIDNVLSVTAGGITTVVSGTTLVKVAVNADVTIQLPSSKTSLVTPAGALPGTWLELLVTIVDTGGFAAVHNITILPYGAETIMGLASLTISVAYGGYTLLPIHQSSTGGWTQQP